MQLNKTNIQNVLPLYDSLSAITDTLKQSGVPFLFVIDISTPGFIEETGVNRELIMLNEGQQPISPTLAEAIEQFREALAATPGNKRGDGKPLQNI